MHAIGCLSKIIEVGQSLEKTDLFPDTVLFFGWIGKPAAAVQTCSHQTLLSLLLEAFEKFGMHAHFHYCRTVVCNTYHVAVFREEQTVVRTWKSSLNHDCLIEQS